MTFAARDSFVSRPRLCEIYMLKNESRKHKATGTCREGEGEIVHAASILCGCYFGKYIHFKFV